MIEAVFGFEFLHIEQVAGVEFSDFLGPAEAEGLWGDVLVDVVFLVEVFYYLE